MAADICCHYDSLFCDLLAVHSSLRSFVRERYGNRIPSWTDSVPYHYGLFDLRAALAGKILARDCSNRSAFATLGKLPAGFAGVRME